MCIQGKCLTFHALIWHQTFDPNDWIPTDNGEFPKYSQSKNHLKNNILQTISRIKSYVEILTVYYCIFRVGFNNRFID